MNRSSLSRKLTNMRRVFGIGVKSFARNAWLSIAATVVMSITLACVLITIFSSYTLSNTVESFTQKIDVSIFFKDSASKDQIEDLSTALRNEQSLGVTEVSYISKEQARETFELENKDDIKTLQAIAQADDAFPASIRVKTMDTDNLQKVVEFARSDKYASIIDSDSYKDDAKRTAIERLGSAAKFLRNAGLLASVVFGVISGLVILNTIRMAIFNRKDEIEMMQLIGASKWYIRGPFLVEAGMYGLIAGVIASLSFFIVILNQAPKLGDYVQEISPTVEAFSSAIVPISLATVLAGICLGVFSAYLAIRKHLKLKFSK